MCSCPAEVRNSLRHSWQIHFPLPFWHTKIESKSDKSCRFSQILPTCIWVIMFSKRCPCTKRLGHQWVIINGYERFKQSRFCCNKQNFLISGAWSPQKNLAVLHSLTQHMKYHATGEKKKRRCGAVVSLNTKLFPRKIFCFSSEASWAKGA